MKARKRVRRKASLALPAATEDLNASSAALLGQPDTRDAAVTVQRNESIEDPLQDWPESTGDADRWLNERPGGPDQERGD